MVEQKLRVLVTYLSKAHREPTGMMMRYKMMPAKIPMISIK
jgi:hypothetical protein